MKERDPKNKKQRGACYKKNREEREKNFVCFFEKKFNRFFFLFFESSSDEKRRGKLQEERDLSSNDDDDDNDNKTREYYKRERENQHDAKSWRTPPLSPLLRFYRCSPFRRRLRLVGERGGEGAKEAPIIR